MYKIRAILHVYWSLAHIIVSFILRYLSKNKLYLQIRITYLTMDSILLGQWDRLYSIIKWSGLSTHAFAREIELKRSENLYRIKYNKNAISRKLVAMITKRYPEISDVWLMTGSGSMLRNDEYGMMRDMPYYSIGINQYLECPQRFTSRFCMPSNFDADFAIDIGSSTIDEILPAGGIAMLKKTTVNRIMNGKAYYVITEFFNAFCILSKSTVEDEILIKNSSFDKTDNITPIKTSDIKELFLVDGYIKKI